MDSTTYLEALRLELEYASRPKGGGQPPDPARIKAIEAEIARAGGKTKRSNKAADVEDTSAATEPLETT